MPEPVITYRIMGRRTDGSTGEWHHQSREWSDKAEALAVAKGLNGDEAEDAKTFGFSEPRRSYRVVKVTSTIEEVPE